MPKEEPFAGRTDSAGALGGGAGLWVVVVVSGGLLLLLAAVVTGVTSRILPSPLASKVGYNSEGYLFASVLIPWVYYLARHPRSRRRAHVSGLLGALWLVAGWGLLNSSLPSAIKTLNEPALALGIVLPYVALRRPFAGWVPPTLVCSCLIAIGLGMLTARPDAGVPMGQDNWVIYLGEGVFLVLLTVVALDLVERWMLDASAWPLPRAWRGVFYAMLVATPIVVSAMGSSARVGDLWHNMTLNYLGRVHESFVGVFLVCGTLLLVSWVERREGKSGVPRRPQSPNAVLDDVRPQTSARG